MKQLQIGVFILATGCLLLGIARSGEGQETKSAKPTSSSLVSTPSLAKKSMELSVVERQGMQKVGPSVGRYDCGSVDPLETPRLERLFTLRNDTKSPMKIDRLKASCGCESLLMTRNGIEQKQPTLASGETVDVKVAVSILHARSGTKQAFVWAYAEKETTPLATMEITAQIAKTVEFAPPVVNFGKVSIGGGGALSLTVTLDERLAPSGKLPLLASSTPQVVVQPQGEERKERSGNKTVVRRSYRVLLSPEVPSGFLSASLRFTANAGTTSTGQGSSGRTSANTSALNGVSVSVMAEVAGSITASPSILVFGAIPAGKGIKRQVLLSAGSLKALQGVKVTSSSSWLTINVHDPQLTGNGKARAVQMVEATLSAQTPLGPLKARLDIVTATGEKLSLNVIGEIERSK